MLSPKQLQAIPLIFVASNIKEVIEAVGVTRTTWANWMKDVEFTNEIKSMQRCLMRKAMTKILSLQGKAADKVGDLIDSEDEEIATKATRLAMEFGHPAFAAIENINHAELFDYTSADDAREGGGQEKPDTTQTEESLP
jgi:hypothetical protein